MNYSKLIEIIKGIMKKKEIEYLPTTTMIKSTNSKAYKYMKEFEITPANLADNMGLLTKKNWILAKEKAELRNKKEIIDEETLRTLRIMKYIKSQLKENEEVSFIIKREENVIDGKQRKKGKICSKTKDIFTIDNGKYKESFRYKDIFSHRIEIKML